MPMLIPMENLLLCLCHEFNFKHKTEFNCEKRSVCFRNLTSAICDLIAHETLSSLVIRIVVY